MTLTRHFFNLALNIAVLSWVAWRGAADMLIVDEWHWDIAAVVAASVYLLVGPFALSLARSVRHARRLRQLRADMATGRTFE